MTASTLGTTRPASPTSRLGAFASDIKISHTLFAMPWAILSAVLGSAVAGLTATQVGSRLALVIVCMASARTFAMALNRILDAQLDRQNPRTARRAIPSGALSARYVTVAAAISAAVFVIATAGFGVFVGNWIPLVAAVPVLGILGLYPLLKRFTWLCHFYLGACLALAPVCAWIAVTGSVTLAPILMAAAVLCWTAGFDIIYACQDYESDRQTGVFSVPAAVGIARALWLSRLTHAVCIAMLSLLAGQTPQYGPIFWTAVGLITVLLFVEHLLVSPRDLSRVNLAFFTINGVISLLAGALGVLDVYV